SHHQSHLLGTIRSRTQNINVLAVDEDASKALLDTYKLDDKRYRQTMFLAHGRPAELIRLAADEEHFEQQASLITDARTFLQSNSYERLVIIKKYSDRPGSLHFLGMCTRLLRFNLLKQHHYASADL